MTAVTPLPDAQLSGLAASNAAFPDHLIPSCIAKLEQVEKEIADIDPKIDSDAHKSRLLREREAYISLLAPYRRLPNELIALIIRCALENPDCLDERDRKRFARLRLVCKRWGDVALATPALWSGLQVNLNSQNQAYWTLDAFIDWFKRAGDKAPWRLRLSTDYHNSLEELLRSLLLSHRNWADIRLHIPASTFRALLQPSPAPDPSSHTVFATLKRFYLGLDISQDEREWTYDLGPCNFPHLKDLRLTTGSGRLRPFSFGTGNMTLTSIHLTGHYYHWTMNPVELASALSYGTLPALEEVILDALSPEPRGEHKGSPILSNPTVRRLVIIGTHTILTTSHITFPSLDFLRLTAVRFFSSRRRRRAMAAFLVRSADNLSTFSLEGSHLDQRDEAHLICRVSHSVRQLCVDSCSFFKDIARKSEGCRFPSLETIISIYPFLGRDIEMLSKHIIGILHPTSSGQVTILTPPCDFLPDSEKHQYTTALDTLRQRGICIEDNKGSKCLRVNPIISHWYEPFSFIDTAWTQYQHNPNPDDFDPEFYEEDGSSA